MIILCLVCADATYIPSAESISFHAFFFFQVIWKSLLLRSKKLGKSLLIHAMNSSLPAAFSITAWYLFKRLQLQKPVNTIMKVYQACFNIRFINYIRNFCFGFCAYSLGTFSLAGSNFSQNHSGTKHLYGDFCAEIPSFSSEIPSCWDGMKNVLASYKENIAFKKKWLYAYPVYCLVPQQPLRNTCFIYCEELVINENAT